MPTQEIRQPPTLFYGYTIVLVTFIITMVVEGLLYSFGVFFKPLLTDFGWTRAMASGAFSIASILKIPIAVVAGRLTDRFGPKQVLAACGFFLGLGYLLISQTGNIWHLYLFYGVLVGIGMGLYWVPLMSIIPLWFVRKRAFMMGVVVSGIGVGQLTIPPLANWLISNYGWRISYLIVGSICMVTIIICAQFLKHDPSQIGLLPDGESKPKQENPITAAEAKEFSVHEAVSTKQFWLFCIVFLPWMFCLSVILVHGVIHAIGLGMSPTSAAYILSIIGIAGIVGRLAFGRLADLIGIKPVLIISLGLMSLAFFWLIVAKEMWMLYLFAAIFGIAYGTFEILQSPIVAELFGLSSLGTIFGIALAIGSIGFVIGPVVAGYIFDVTNNYQIAFVICTALSLISLASALLLPLTKTKGK